MAVTIGEMNRRVTVQRKTSVPDESGQPQDTWEDVCSWKVAVEPLNAREAIAARQSEVVVTHKVTGWRIRELHENAPLMRLMLCGRVLNVISAVETDNRRQLELLCAEAQPWQNQ